MQYSLPPPGDGRRGHNRAITLSYINNYNFYNYRGWDVEESSPEEQRKTKSWREIRSKKAPQPAASDEYR